MPIELEDPMLRIEHDHTHLDVLFDDLYAVAMQSLKGENDEDLLEDIPKHWRDLHEEIARHFGREERKVFAPLKVLFPELAPRIDLLCGQHREMRRLLTDLGQKMKAAPEELASRRTEFDEEWRVFGALWKQHSDIEWELLQVVHTQIEASAEDDTFTEEAP